MCINILLCEAQYHSYSRTYIGAIFILFSQSSAAN
jgi:hypothetical protein